MGRLLWVNGTMREYKQPLDLIPVMGYLANSRRNSIIDRNLTDDGRRERIVFKLYHAAATPIVALGLFNYAELIYQLIK